MMPLNKIAIFVFLALAFTSPLYAAENPWQLKTSKDGITVYTRKVDGSEILEFKATMTVDTPLAKIIPVFDDEKKLSSWYYQCTHSELVKKEDPNNKIVYIVLHLTWPVTERDSYFRETKSIDEKNSSVNYSIQALPDYLPAKSGKVRVLMINSHWSFTPLSDGKTEIYFQQHSNPGGSIPSFLVNALAVDTPMNSLKNFRRSINAS
jgi:hypothetical protein